VHQRSNSTLNSAFFFHDWLLAQRRQITAPIIIGAAAGDTNFSRAPLQFTLRVRLFIFSTISATTDICNSPLNNSFQILN